MNAVAAIILVTIGVDFILNVWADYLNLKTLRANVPEAFKGVYEPDQYLKSQEYLRVNTRFGWITGTLNVIRDAVGEGHDAARVDPQRLALELFLDDRPARVDECFPVTSESLKYESFAAKEPRSPATVEGDVHLGAEGRGQEGILLTCQLPTDLRQIDGYNLARIGSGESHSPFARTVIREVGDKD